MTIFDEFTINNTPCNLTVTKTHLNITRRGKSERKLFGATNINRNIPLNEILSVNLSNDSQSSDIHLQSRENGSYINVFIVTRKKNFRWKLTKVMLKSSDSQSCEKIKEDIQHNMNSNNDVLSRPKSLLIFVNPFGGSRKAKEIYDGKVKSLFEQLQIKTHVIITEYKQHAKKFIEENDVSIYDGIIAVGGDGMLNEIMNGILLKVQKENSINVDVDDPRNTPVYASPDIRLGIIPAGSTDCVSYATQGINDPITSTLHILVGDSHPIDVVSVHDKNGILQQFSVSMTGYGFFGDVLKKSENLRWMGPPRYDYAGFQVYLKNKSYPGKIRYIKSKADLIQSASCRFPCGVCQQGWDDANITSKKSPSSSFLPPPDLEDSSSDTSSKDGISIKLDADNTSFVSTNSISEKSENIQLELYEDPERPNTLDVKTRNDSKDEKWESTSGNFTLINALTTSCACETSPLGLSPNSHLADGSLDLVMVEKCSHKQLLQYLIAQKGSGDRFHFPFVKAVRVKSFQFVPMQQEGVKNTEDDSGGFVGRIRRSLSTGNTQQSSVTLNRRMTVSTCTEEIREEVESIYDDNLKSIWNSDGEIINDPEITVHVHRGLIKMFCRGIEKQA